MSVRKPPESRARGARTRDLVAVPIVVDVVSDVPVPADHWSDAVVEQWGEFWRSPLADDRVTTSADMAALVRLFDFRQRLVEALEAFDAEPVVLGSSGQDVLSPWAAEVHRLVAVVDRLEAHFGCTPAARLKLGVSVAQAGAAVARAARDRAPAGRYSSLRGGRDAVEGNGTRG